MQNVIISDTSCLILLDKIGEMHLLNQLFGKILITEQINFEFKNELPNWFIIKNPENLVYQKILEASLDKGEASAIALAIESKECLVILDDLKGRKYAQKLGLNVTGTLVNAKLCGYLKSIKPVLDKLKATNFRISKKLERKILINSNELY